MKKQTLIFIVIVVFAVVAVIAISFFTGSRNGKVVIGSILPLSGDYAQWGEQEKIGIQLGLSQLDPKIRDGVEVVFYDHEAQKEKALDALKQMQARGVHYCAEIMSSGIVLHCGSFFNEHKIIVISGANTLGLLSDKGGQYFFRIIPSDSLSAKAMADWAIKEGWENAIVVHDISEWGMGLKAEIERSFTAANGNILSILETKEGTNDFSYIVTKIKQETPQIVFLLTYPREAALIIKEVRSQQLPTKFMGTDNFTDPIIIKASNKALNDVFYVIPKETAATINNEYRKLSALYAKHTGKEEQPPPFLVYGYDLVRILAKVAEEAGTNMEKALDLMKNIEFVGASGKIKFDEHGDLEREVGYTHMSFEVKKAGKEKIALRVVAQ